MQSDLIQRLRNGLPLTGNGYSLTQENLAVTEALLEEAATEIERLHNGIWAWLSVRMKSYTEAQYGKGELRALLQEDPPVEYNTPQDSVESIIEDCIARYPTLYQSRTAVLHQLFLVLGSGYRWSNGALVPERVYNRTDQISRAFAAELAKISSTIDNPDPWYDGNNLSKMPSDVLPEWKAAAKELEASLPFGYLHLYKKGGPLNE